MSINNLITKNMKAVVGSIIEEKTLLVEPGSIEKFAVAIGDPNPIYYKSSETIGDRMNDRVLAPPTFLRTLSPAILPLPDAGRFTRIVDGGSNWQYFMPIRAGDRISYRVLLKSLSEKEGKAGPMLLATYLIQYRNQNDSLVANQENTLIRFV